VKALDKRYNQSEPSSILEVEKPLKVKPSSPVFNRFEVTTDGILLSWIKSPGQEVLKHILYRSSGESADYKPLKVFQQNEDPTYVDTQVEGGMTYSYEITAESKWNIESDPSPSIQLTASPAEAGRIALKQLKAGIDREKRTVTLSWNGINPEKVKEWKVYRAENNQQISLWQLLSGNARSVIDDNIFKAGNFYHYMIIATMKDGSNSRPEEISINY
jgi:fibronectin type 3 domain-containing protein